MCFLCNWSTEIGLWTNEIPNDTYMYLVVHGRKQTRKQARKHSTSVLKLDSIYMNKLGVHTCKCLAQFVDIPFDCFYQLF